MERQQQIHLEIQKRGKSWAVLVDGQLVALTLYRKEAVVVEALLRGLAQVTGRRLFRAAVKEALTATATAECKAPKRADAKSA
jgi:hypothetical protein